MPGHDLGLDPAADPSLEEVLAVRRQQHAEVADPGA